MPINAKKKLVEELSEVKDLRRSIEFELKLEVESLLREFEEIKKQIATEEAREEIPSEKELLARLVGELQPDKVDIEVRVGRKSIDMVCEKGNVIWVAEAKKQLDYKAVGQVLSYMNLYKKRNGKEIKTAIVCWYGDSQIESACQELGIEVFVVGRCTDGLNT